MWCKVNELSEKGLKIWQISLLLGIHRQTVRKYCKMSREEFEMLVKRPYHNRTKKLRAYVEFVSDLLVRHPYLTSPQVLDRRDVSAVEKELVGRYQSDKVLRDKLSAYLDSIREERPRYYNASVRILSGLFEQLPVHMTSMLLDTLAETKTTNAYDAVEIANSLLVRHSLAPLKKQPSRYGRRGRRETTAANLAPQRSDLASYETIINELTKN